MQWAGVPGEGSWPWCPASLFLPTHSRECNQLGLAGLSAVGHGVWQKDTSIV